MPMNSRILVSIFLLIFLLPACRQTQSGVDYKIQKQAFANKAMVVSAHPLATRVGVEVMRNGGNAIDAAVAVQFALAVVYPVAGYIGGGGFMIFRKNNGEKYTLDFREKAPAKAHRDMYLDSLDNVIEGLSINGHLAAGVPGSVDGMVTAHKRFGKTPFKELVLPSVALAEQGFAITQMEADRLEDFKERFIKYNTFTPVFIKEATWKKGDLLQQKELGWTMKQIAEQGREGFYAGPVAEKIVAEMKAGGGIISLEDLKNYKAAWRDPVLSEYKGYDIISMPPPSSGGIALTQLLQMVEPYALKEKGFHSPATVHLMAEAERRVYADRAKHLGDSDFYPVPKDNLLAADYLTSRMEDFNPNQVTSSDSIIAGVFTVPKESEQTTHFSIIDTEGNAVSITTTINSGYGSKTVVNGAGFILNNEMDDFSSKPGTPNFYGLLGAEANAIEPGKRMLSSMTPTIVEKEDQLFMVVGTPGGSTIITSVFQTILNVIEFDMGMAEAVSTKRFHHQWKPDKLQFEKGTFDATQQAALSKLGHEFRERNGIGKVDAILVLPDGRLEGGADPRGDDHAEGF